MKILFFLLFFLTALPVVMHSKERTQGTQKPFIQTLSGEEEAYVKKMQQKGFITVAHRVKEAVYFQTEDGSFSGLHYELATIFAQSLNLKLVVKTVKFSDYFSKNGIVPEEVKNNMPPEGYEPDLLKKVDFFADNLTIMPWREKILKFIPLYQTKEILITRKGEEIRTLKELLNKRFALQKNTSYEETVKHIEKKLGTRFEIFYTETTEEMPSAVIANKADVAILDGYRAFQRVKMAIGLSASMSVSRLQSMGWATGINNPLLASIIQKFFDRIKSDGTLEKVWSRHHTISMKQYEHLLNY